MPLTSITLFAGSPNPSQGDALANTQAAARVQRDELLQSLAILAAKANSLWDAFLKDQLYSLSVNSEAKKTMQTQCTELAQAWQAIKTIIIQFNIDYANTILLIDQSATSTFQLTDKKINLLLEIFKYDSRFALQPFHIRKYLEIEDLYKKLDKAFIGLQKDFQQSLLHQQNNDYPHALDTDVTSFELVEAFNTTGKYPSFWQVNDGSEPQAQLKFSESNFTEEDLDIDNIPEMDTNFKIQVESDIHLKKTYIVHYQHMKQRIAGVEKKSAAALQSIQDLSSIFSEDQRKSNLTIINSPQIKPITEKIVQAIYKQMHEKFTDLLAKKGALLPQEIRSQADALTATLGNQIRYEVEFNAVNFINDSTPVRTLPLTITQTIKSCQGLLQLPSLVRDLLPIIADVMEKIPDEINKNVSKKELRCLINWQQKLMIGYLDLIELVIRTIQKSCKELTNEAEKIIQNLQNVLNAGNALIQDTANGVQQTSDVNKMDMEKNPEEKGLNTEVASMEL